LASSTLISLDAMGGDHGPAVVVGGVKAYYSLYGGDSVRFLLHGDEAAIRAEMARLHVSDDLCQVWHTDKVVAMDEKPAQAMRRVARARAFGTRSRRSRRARPRGLFPPATPAP